MMNAAKLYEQLCERDHIINALLKFRSPDPTNISKADEFLRSVGLATSFTRIAAVKLEDARRVDFADVLPQELIDRTSRLSKMLEVYNTMLRYANLDEAK